MSEENQRVSFSLEELEEMKKLKAELGVCQGHVGIAFVVHSKGIDICTHCIDEGIKRLREIPDSKPEWKEEG